MPERIGRLIEAGQSPWLDFIDRHILQSGKLQEMVTGGWITGLTSNPSIFAKAITGSNDYDSDLAALAARGVADPYEAFVSLAVDDIRAAADILRPIWERTGGLDGFVSLELPPGVEDDADRAVAEAERLFSLVDRPNVMIKVPGTDAGVEALARLTDAGVNVNVTLLFSVDVYERFAEAYIASLNRRLERGAPVDAVTSVASFFVSRVDTAVDPQLPEGSPLRGTAAVANALEAYRRFERIFAGDRWTNLERLGARVQRPLWGSTSTKNPDYRDVMYIEQLILPQTVNTIPEATLRAFADHGDPTPVARDALDAAPDKLAELAAAGIDMEAVTRQLLVDGLASFAKDFEGMLASIRESLVAVGARG